LTDAEGDRDRPACAVAPTRGGVENPARFLTCECLDLGIVRGRRLDERRHVPAHLVSPNGDGESARKDAVDLQHRRGGQASIEHLLICGVEVFGE
jgi:hypothetical protein